MNKNERGWNESFPGENIRQIQRKKDIRGNRCRTVYWKLQHGGLWVNWPTFYRWKKKKKKKIERFLCRLALGTSGRGCCKKY